VFEFLETLGLIDSQPAVFFAPFVIGHVTDAELPSNLSDRFALALKHVGFVEFSDDLFCIMAARTGNAQDTNELLKMIIPQFVYLNHIGTSTGIQMLKCEMLYASPLTEVKHFNR
jgi:hypothetical protein